LTPAENKAITIADDPPKFGGETSKRLSAEDRADWQTGKVVVMDQETVPCPFVYASGKRCTGHVTLVEVYKADLSWDLQHDGTWKFE
jgi:hypothetical protein